MNLEQELNQVWFDMSQVANVLQLKINNKVIGRNQIYKLLRQKRVFQVGNNLPYRKYINLGYFIIKKTVVKREGQYDRETYKTLVSTTGIEFIKTTLIQ